MGKYYDTVPQNLKEYFHILSSDYPEFLEDYIDTPEMQKQSKISVTCGTIYPKMFGIDMWYSSLDHSVAVALIIWHFTKDKKQTLSGLLHDISTPVFKHCVDFMNGDHENQESTEELTTKIIENSKELMSLLKRDNIDLCEVDDYHIYPIADNDTPKLSADRLEYTFSNGLGVRKHVWTLEEVREVYSDISIFKNEDGIDELGFNTISNAEKFVHNMSILSRSYVDNKTKLAMQFFADVLKTMSNRNLITLEEMYNISEAEVIERIKNCKYDNIANAYDYYTNLDDVKTSETKVANTYCVSIKAKLRYIVPLVKVGNDTYARVDTISTVAKEDIAKAVNYKTEKYAYIDTHIDGIE